jgi:alpha/beta superfamily hydrolase
VAVKKHKLRIKGPAGAIETVIEEPAGEPRGLALVAHPHPLRGGSLDNKVAWTLARAAMSCGLVAIRPNFRGVGDSEGEFDHGVGETEDLLAVARAVEAHYGVLPWTLLGFSFGAYVQQRVAKSMHAQRLIMVGPAVSMYEFEPTEIPATIIHGDQDEVIPFAAARDYAAAHAIPLIVVAGCGHFFHGRLRELQDHVEALCHP